MSGDVSADNMGLSQNDINEIVSNVEIMVHCAASLRFTDKVSNMIQITLCCLRLIIQYFDQLKTTINTNTIGTLRALQLAETMKKLKAFCYISTAFVHCYRSRLEERYYPTHLDPFEIISSTQRLSDDELNLLEKTL